MTKIFKVPKRKGYVRSSMACRYLSVTRERLRQLKKTGRIEVIVPFKFPLYKVSSMFFYLHHKRKSGRPKKEITVRELANKKLESILAKPLDR